MKDSVLFGLYILALFGFAVYELAKTKSKIAKADDSQSIGESA